jgi:hypothetical protein
MHNLFCKNIKKVKQQDGSILILATFIVLAISMICVSYWILIKVNTKMIFLKEKNLQTYYAALGGIEDAISEFRNGESWGVGVGFNSRWSHSSGSTYYKSNRPGSPAPLPHFSYPVTITVTVVGDPAIETLNITCQSEINTGNMEYKKTLSANVIRSLSNEVHVVNIGGID